MPPRCRRASSPLAPISYPNRRWQLLPVSTRAPIFWLPLAKGTKEARGENIARSVSAAKAAKAAPCGSRGIVSAVPF